MFFYFRRLNSPSNSHLNQTKSEHNYMQNPKHANNYWQQAKTAHFLTEKMSCLNF